MALVQYRNDLLDINIQRGMPAPKKIEKLEAWFKQARKVIPQIPDAPNGLWNITHQSASIKWISFELETPQGERCYVIIDRQRSALG